MQSGLDNLNSLARCTSAHEALRFYGDIWKDQYDNDHIAMGYLPWSETAKAFEKYAMDTDSVLDLAGGTGAIVDLIRKTGYNGAIDILDGSLPMLVVAEKKELKLRNIFRHFVQEDGILPLKHESYDVVICGGAFFPNHLPVTAFKEMFNVIKKGGLAIVNCRSGNDAKYEKDFMEAIKELKEAGRIEIVEEQEIPHFKTIEESFNTNLYVFKRL